MHSTCACGIIPIIITNTENFMLHFLKERSYDIVKMLLYQIAIALFGISLAIATGPKEGTDGIATLQVASSILSILFYLILIYIMMWDLGAKDAGRIKRGEDGTTRLTGLYMSLVASIPNFLLATFISLGLLLADVPFFSNLGGGSATVALLVEGMYTGLLAIRVGGAPLNSVWFMWFLIIVPLIVTATTGYYAGTKEFKIFPTPPKKD